MRAWKRRESDGDGREGEGEKRQPPPPTTLSPAQGGKRRMGDGVDDNDDGDDFHHPCNVYYHLRVQPVISASVHPISLISTSLLCQPPPAVTIHQPLFVSCPITNHKDKSKNGLQPHPIRLHPGHPRLRYRRGRRPRQGEIRIARGMRRWIEGRGAAVIRGIDNIQARAWLNSILTEGLKLWSDRRRREELDCHLTAPGNSVSSGSEGKRDWQLGNMKDASLFTEAKY